MLCSTCLLRYFIQISLALWEFSFMQNFVRRRGIGGGGNGRERTGKRRCDGAVLSGLPVIQDVSNFLQNVARARVFSCRGLLHVRKRLEHSALRSFVSSEELDTQLTTRRLKRERAGGYCIEAWIQHTTRRPKRERAGCYCTET